ncbi:MAG: hypothetical protein ACK5LO_05525 [Leucobacter sp.]
MFDRQPDLIVREETVNGEPGLVATAGDRVFAVLTVALGESGIESVWVVRNPAKLAPWSG